jgi:hypothetical protein
LTDGARGCLTGLAIGDALGTRLEFSRRDANPHWADTGARATPSLG